MSGAKILFMLKRIRLNLEDPSIDKNDPAFLEYLCGELAELTHHISEMILKQGDERYAIRILDECEEFLKMRDIFESLAKKEASECV